MIALYLIAAHMLGDFVLQTRWQAATKFDNAAARAWHGTTYTLCFVPVAFAYHRWGWPTALTFLAAVWTLHFLTDSRRFRSTLGDVIVWRDFYRHDPQAAVTARLDDFVAQTVLEDPSPETIARMRENPPKIDGRWPPPNPWPPTSLLIDQTLHIVQLAVLGGLLLR